MMALQAEGVGVRFSSLLPEIFFSMGKSLRTVEMELSWEIFLQVLARAGRFDLLPIELQDLATSPPNLASEGWSCMHPIRSESPPAESALRRMSGN
jgi:hypothetical protein